MLFMRLLIFAFLTLMLSCNNKLAPSEWNWMVGKWVQTKSDGQVVEEWTKTNDSTYAGLSYSLNASGEKKMLESVELIRRAGVWSYIPSTLGTETPNPVSFQLVSFGPYGFTATNPQHDFPKRIVYERKGNDSLHAWIDGGESAPDTRMDFFYSRSGK